MYCKRWQLEKRCKAHIKLGLFLILTLYFEDFGCRLKSIVISCTSNWACSTTLSRIKHCKKNTGIFSDHERKPMEIGSGVGGN